MKRSTKAEVERHIRQHPVYQEHIEADGEPELISDPKEAYEVAHATKYIEERYKESVKGVAHYYDNYEDSRYDGWAQWVKDEDRDAAQDHYKTAQARRIAANKLGAHVGKVHKDLHSGAL